MRKKHLSDQSGRSMIEALGYISVMIAVTTALSVAVNSGFYRYRVGRINQELVDLKKVVSQRYVAAESYKDVNMNTLKDEKIIPHDVRDGTHSFGGEVNVGKGYDDNTYKITFKNVPVHACVELGSKLWIVNDGSDLDAMEINGTSWAWKYSNYKQKADYELPAKPTEVAKACNSKKSKESDLTWYFN